MAKCSVTKKNVFFGIFLLCLMDNGRADFDSLNWQFARDLLFYSPMMRSFILNNSNPVLKEASDVQITFNDLDIKGCTNINLIIKRESILDLKVTKNCSPLEQLKKEVREKKGNFLLIKSLYTGCDLAKYNAEGYLCKKK